MRSPSSSAVRFGAAKPPATQIRKPAWCRSKVLTRKSLLFESPLVARIAGIEDFAIS